jgi:hypothetical protein
MFGAKDLTDPGQCVCVCIYKLTLPRYTFCSDIFGEMLKNKLMIAML